MPDLPSVAKAYILYRAERTRAREMNTRLMKTYEEIATRDSRLSDLKRDNANIDGDTAMGSMLKYGSEGAKIFNEMYILKPEHAKAHNDGDIHIHDFDFYTLDHDLLPDRYPKTLFERFQYRARIPARTERYCQLLGLSLHHHTVESKRSTWRTKHSEF